MNAQQRCLFLLVFLWTCLCLYLLRSHNSQINEPPPVPQALLAYELDPTQANYHIDSRQQPEPATASQLSSSNIQVSSAPSLVPSDQVSPSSSISSTTSSRHQQQQVNSDIINNEQQQVEIATRITKFLKNNNHLNATTFCDYDYPSLLDLQFNNIHWQRMQAKQAPGAPPDLKREHPEQPAQAANYYLYNAYYDDRWRAKGASVRILAMIDRNSPPDTNCLLWSKLLQNSSKKTPSGNKMVPLITRATFVYAWYPKWGNHHDGFLQPWIVTCPIPHEFAGFVPDSVSLVQTPTPIMSTNKHRSRRSPVVGVSDLDLAPPNSIAMPPGSSSVSPATLPAPAAASSSSSSSSSISDDSSDEDLGSMREPSVFFSAHQQAAKNAHNMNYDCKQTLPITNNLPVNNVRPANKQKFAVCVKGLDFPNDDLSVRLVEWIELLNLLGASKIFLYNLNVHENITRVLHYYKERGLVELIPLTLPGDQPNLPEYQHQYLKQRLTTKRQNELIPYNDCLYRNLYSYQYLALLDIDEIIMPLKHHTWFGLMDEVERVSLLEQNYSRASYNTRNVYFFDDLMGPLGTTSSSTTSSDKQNEISDQSQDQQNQEQQVNFEHGERGIPHYLHMMQHVYRSKNYTKPGQYVKCFHNTERVVSLHNHFPMNCFGQCTTYSIPTSLAHLQHYRRDCVGPLKQACKNDFRLFTTRDTTIWKYKQQMIRRATRVLSHLDLLEPAPGKRGKRSAGPGKDPPAPYVTSNTMQ